MAKHIVSARDLEDFGFYLLTGEADRTCTRILCDVDRRGLTIFCTAYGLKVPPPMPTDKLREWLKTSSFESNWNGGTEDYPHVASVMIGHPELRQLAFFALWCDGAETIVTTENNGVYGFYDIDVERRGSDRLQEFIDELRRVYGVINAVPGPGKNILTAPDGRVIAVGDRNVHQASGRVQ